MKPRRRYPGKFLRDTVILDHHLRTSAAVHDLEMTDTAWAHGFLSTKERRRRRRELRKLLHRLEEIGRN